jgi:hypothetical protein
MKLSEKGFEQRSDRGFGWYAQGEIDRKAPLWRPAGLRCERVRGFSDSFYLSLDKNSGFRRTTHPTEVRLGAMLSSMMPRDVGVGGST